MKRSLRLLAPLLALLLAGETVSYAQKTKTVTTKSGLKYEVLKEGTGASSKAGDVAQVRYTLWLASNNKKIDSNVGGDPFGFVLGKGEVVKGFDEGVLGMKAGGKRKLHVPSRLGYGEKGADDDIPANSDLIFEVELVKIVPLAQTKSNAKIIETKSGLKYQDIKEGTGAAAKDGDTVKVHYVLWLKDGKVVDTSHKRGKPFPVTIGTSRVIKGWHEGLTGMKAGGKRKLMIPYPLAYGEKGRPPVIPAKAELIFEIEALEISRE